MLVSVGGPRHCRRRGVSGILSALILFALVFTVGFSFFVNVNNGNQMVDQANANRLAASHSQSLENLTLAPALTGSTLTLRVHNIGGVSSTIVAAFVTNQTGRMYTSPSTGSPYMTRHTDLSIDLPLTLTVGEDTAQMTGCLAGNCNIAFNSTTYVKGRSVLLSVLTQYGNVFSAAYPLTTVTEVTNSTLNVTNQTNIIYCLDCQTSSIGGGSTLDATITATPSPVQTGATITATVQFWDSSSDFDISGVNVTITAMRSGSASVTPIGGNCGGVFSAPKESGGVPNYKSCTATFTANAGYPGGTVVFGVAVVGCYQDGSHDNCPAGAPTGAVVSAAAASNPVQIGNILTFGPWSINFNYFEYTAKQQQTRSPAGVIPDSYTYVAFYINLTNTYTAPLRILDYSYLQFISPGTEVDQYIVNSTSYGGSTPTITAANSCTDSPPLAPTGTGCATVNPGQSVIIEFAGKSTASSGSNWGWGTSYSGGTNVGNTAQIIIAYALQTSPGVYSIYAQNIPFESVFIE